MTRVPRPIALVLCALLAAPLPAQETRPSQAALGAFRAGQQAFQKEEFDAAVADFRAAIASDPQFAAAHCALGQTYMTTRRYSDAVEALVQCKALTERLAHRSAAELAGIMEKAGLPFAPIRRPEDLLEDEHLPRPRTNRNAGGKRVDCRWPDHKLTVELDSYRYHHSRHAWEQDRRRDREAHARGDQHRRYTYGDVFEDPRQLLAELHALLT